MYEACYARDGQISAREPACGETGMVVDVTRPSWSQSRKASRIYARSHWCEACRLDAVIITGGRIRRGASATRTHSTKTTKGLLKLDGRMEIEMPIGGNMQINSLVFVCA